MTPFTRRAILILFFSHIFIYVARNWYGDLDRDLGRTSLRCHVLSNATSLGVCQVQPILVYLATFPFGAVVVGIFKPYFSGFAVLHAIGIGLAVYQQTAGSVPQFTSPFRVPVLVRKGLILLLVLGVILVRRVVNSGGDYSIIDRATTLEYSSRN